MTIYAFKHFPRTLSWIIFMSEKVFYSISDSLHLTARALTGLLARSLRSLPRSLISELLMSQNDLNLPHSATVLALSSFRVTPLSEHLCQLTSCRKTGVLLFCFAAFFECLSPVPSFYRHCGSEQPRIGMWLWALDHSLVRPLAHLFFCSSLFDSLTRPAALIRSLAP